MDTPGGDGDHFVLIKKKGMNICKDLPRKACSRREERGKPTLSLIVGLVLSLHSFLAWLLKFMV